MKLFIPFKIKDAGGTSIFAKKFSQSFSKNGDEVFFDFKKDFDVLFIIADSPLKYVFYAKIKGKKIIQRLDGVYHKGVSKWPMYFLYNLKMMIIRKYFTDFIIYQSKFSKISCDKMLGKTTKNFEIIYNGVDVEKIKPSEPKQKNETVRLLTFSVFRRLDQIKPIIESVKELDEGFHLDIYGPYADSLSDIFEEVSHLKNVSWKGKISNEELLLKIKEYDIFLFSDQSACPNSVLEALSAGLPVVAFNRGSINEIIEPGKNGEWVKINNSFDPFKDRFPFTQENFQEFSEKIKLVSENINFYKKMARKNAEDVFSLDKMTVEYAEIIKNVFMKNIRKKRVLFILTGSYPLFNPAINQPHGGAEIDTYSIAHHISQKEFDIHFIVGDFGQKRIEIINGIKIYKWTKIENSGFMKGIFNFLKLFYLTIKINPDIIFSKGVSWLSIELLLIGGILRKKNIIKSTHQRNVDGTLNFTLPGKFFSKMINFIDIFILQNFSDKELFIKNFPNYKNRIEVIRNFQEIPSFNPRSLSDNLLWIGRPEKFKRPEIFIKLAKILPHFKFTMIMPRAKKEIFYNFYSETKKIQNITFIPGLPGGKLSEHYLKNSFLISTSENEGFPNVILEAMKYGTPIISFLDFDNIIEKNGCGKIVNNVQEISELIQKISPDEWRKMSENCHNFAKENFDAKIGVKKYEKLFRKI